MSTAERTLKVLSNVVETNEIRNHLDAPLFDSHLLDSLKTVELIIAFSEEFGIEISPAEFDTVQWSTARHIVAYIEERVGQ
jgi:D-alanine--poly(phosphoribitol) ligase subunit 2